MSRLKDIEKAIAAGIFKVLRGSPLPFSQLEKKPVQHIFASVAGPTDWESFYIEAVGNAIQHELIAIKKYCPDLTDELVDWATKDGNRKTWKSLRSLIKAKLEDLN